MGAPLGDLRRLVQHIETGKRHLESGQDWLILAVLAADTLGLLQATQLVLMLQSSLLHWKPFMTRYPWAAAVLTGNDGMLRKAQVSPQKRALNLSNSA